MAKEIKITNINTGEVKTFSTASKVGEFLGITRQAVGNMVHKGAITRTGWMGEFANEEDVLVRDSSKITTTNLPTLIFGIGKNDVVNSTTDHFKGYQAWKNMLERCYREDKKACYNDVTVCEEWLTFSNFLKWFYINYQEGYQLDKDLLSKEDKVYSPETCVYIDPTLNTVLAKTKEDTPKTAIKEVVKNEHYVVVVNKFGNQEVVGQAKTKEMAKLIWKQAKYDYFVEIAEKYKKTNKKVYYALLTKAERYL